MANLEVNNDRQNQLSGTTPLDVPARSSSPNQSPRSSPRASHKKDRPRSERSSTREISPSHLKEPDSEGFNTMTRSIESISALVPELVRSTSQVSQVSQTSGEGKDGRDGKERKESRSSDRVKKKSSWYHALTPTYKSRSEELKKYFKDLPQEERLIVDYSCAVQKDLLIQGRLYVTEKYLCFYANYFRWETVICIRWKDVTSVTKEKTALIIPNAIMISTESDKLFFATFNARDKAFITLFRVWQNALLDKPLSQQQKWKFVHEAYGEELGLSSDDEYYDQIAIDEKMLLISTRQSADSLSEAGKQVQGGDGWQEAHGRSAGEQTSSAADKSSSASPPALGLADVTVSPVSPIDGKRVSGSRGGDATDASDSSESDGERNPRDRLFGDPAAQASISCPATHEGRCYVNMVLPIHIDQLFTLLFTNSKFFLEFHALRRTADIKVTGWQPHGDAGEKIRTVTMVVAINQNFGPKSSNVQETQVMKACSKPGQLYVIDGDVVNSGIPYADSFYVDTHYCLVRVSQHETSLTIYTQLKYKKTVWQLVKSVIEKNTWTNLDEFYDTLSKSLQVECEDSNKGRPHRARSRCITSKPVLLPVQEIVAAQSRSSSIHKRGVPGDTGGRNENLLIIVLIVLLFLLVLNSMLYYKLWVLESWTASSRNTLSSLDLEVLQKPPKTHDEWLQLFRKQESLHRTELARWQAVLQAAVRLLRKAEEALTGLQDATPAPPSSASGR